MDCGLEGFDLFTNLAEDIPGFGRTIDPSLPSKILPLSQEDIPPQSSTLGSNCFLGGNSVSPYSNDPSFPSTPVLDELVSPQDIQILYCDPPSFFSENQNELTRSI
jgi:hypothetical protein